jgi:hypothetical protein
VTSRSGPGESRADPGLNVIVSERYQLINLAYRLGSLRDPAEQRIALLEEPGMKQDRLLPAPCHITTMED